VGSSAARQVSVSAHAVVVAGFTPRLATQPASACASDARAAFRRCDRVGGTGLVRPRRAVAVPSSWHAMVLAGVEASSPHLGVRPVLFSPEDH
jgi:hypothetical protein